MTTEKLLVKFKRLENSRRLPAPTYATANSAGVDLRAAVDGPRTIEPGEISLIPTGLVIELPDGYEAQIRPRSGLALKHGITVLNTPGTIDADYRGEVGVILINHGRSPFIINRGERIAQMVITRYAKVDFMESDTLSDTKRGEGGFGHSGRK